MKTILMAAAGILGVLALLTALFIAGNWAPERSVDSLKARWALPPSMFLEIAGMSVHVRDEGPREDPAPIVLLHGTGSSLHAWEGWAQALKDKHRVRETRLARLRADRPLARWHLLDRPRHRRRDCRPRQARHRRLCAGRQLPWRHDRMADGSGPSVARRQADPRVLGRLPLRVRPPGRSVSNSWISREWDGFFRTRCRAFSWCKDTAMLLAIPAR